MRLAPFLAMPETFDCGCSKAKVLDGNCMIYDHEGKPRGAGASFDPPRSDPIPEWRKLDDAVGPCRPYAPPVLGWTVTRQGRSKLELWMARAGKVGLYVTQSPDGRFHAMSFLDNITNGESFLLRGPAMAAVEQWALKRAIADSAEHWAVIDALSAPRVQLEPVRRLEWKPAGRLLAAEAGDFTVFVGALDSGRWMIWNETVGEDGDFLTCEDAQREAERRMRERLTLALRALGGVR